MPGTPCSDAPLDSACEASSISQDDHKRKPSPLATSRALEPGSINSRTDKMLGHAVLLSWVALSLAGRAAAEETLGIKVTLGVVCDRKTHNGDEISVDYRGTLTNGEEFDSSMRRAKSGFSWPLIADIGNRLWRRTLHL